MSTNLRAAAAGLLLAVTASACGTATADSSERGREVPVEKSTETPSQAPRSRGHIEPPRVVDGLDLVRQVVVE